MRYRIPDPDKKSAPAGNPQKFRKFFRQFFCLIVAPFPITQTVDRNRNQAVRFMTPDLIFAGFQDRAGKVFRIFCPAAVFKSFHGFPVFPFIRKGRKASRKRIKGRNGSVFAASADAGLLPAKEAVTERTAARKKDP